MMVVLQETEVVSMIWGAVMGAVEWNKKEDLVLVSIISNVKGCGSGSAWIHIHFPFWIRIRIQHVDPDQGGKSFQISSFKFLK